MYAGIETGGTKTVCAVGSNGSVHSRAQFPTGDDPVFLAHRCAEFFADYEVEALGIGTFGPCDVDPNSPNYGHILQTPKPGWAHVDLLGLLRAQIDAPTALTTDVNAAALGELLYGNARGYHDVVYITIGTGIGGGVVAGGRLLPSRQHPEMGHMLLPQSVGRGVCPYHGNCFEGLAAGPGMQARAGVPAQDLADDDPAWDVEADIVTAGLHNITLVVAPQCIVIGGGLGSRDSLHSRLPERLAASLNDYVPVPALYPPGLGDDAGVVGALALAQVHTQG